MDSKKVLSTSSCDILSTLAVVMERGSLNHHNASSSDGEGNPEPSVSDRCKLLLGLGKDKHCTGGIAGPSE